MCESYQEFMDFCHKASRIDREVKITACALDAMSAMEDFKVDSGLDLCERCISKGHCNLVNCPHK